MGGRWGQGGGRGGQGCIRREGPQGWSQRRLDRRLEEIAEAVGGGYCRLQMPWKLAFGVRKTVAGHRLGALEVGLCVKGGRLCVPGALGPSGGAQGALL